MCLWNVRKLSTRRLTVIALVLLLGSGCASRPMETPEAMSATPTGLPALPTGPAALPPGVDPAEAAVAPGRPQPAPGRAAAPD